MSDNMPKNMSDKISDRIIEDMSDKMPEDMPNKISKDISEDMLDRIPENILKDMIDRISKDMSDRMPEDLPIIEYINIMVGIIRNIIIIIYLKYIILYFLEII